MSHEFDIIEQFFKPLCQLNSDEVGIGDDGAVVNCPENHQLVVVTDTLIEDRHFPKNTLPYDIAWKALAVNISDLAAMGARPGHFSLALTLPEALNNQDWLSEFAEGLKALASVYQMPLIGGDTTKGHLSVTISAHGWLPKDKALLRSNALQDDDIYVTGVIGDGGLGLKLALESINKASVLYSSQALAKLNRPQPRLEFGMALLDRALSSCAIDVSDGLLADLTHILQASNLSAVVDYDAIPVSQQVVTWLETENNPLLAITAGDDYELCFTANKGHREKVMALAAEFDLKVTKIGELKAFNEAERLLLLKEGKSLPITHRGYQHF